MLCYQLCGEVYCKYNNKICTCTIGKGLEKGYEGMDGVEETGNEVLIRRAWDGCGEFYEEDTHYLKEHGIK